MATTTGQFVDIILLGIAFMLIFTAFQSCGMIQARVLEQAADTSVTNHSSHGIRSDSGYVSLGIIYGSFTMFNFIAAPVVSVLGPKFAMFVGACTYTLYLGSFLYLTSIFLYLCSAILGFGAAIIWTGQGNYLTLNSDEETMGRNSGVIWALFQCSFLFGSIFLFFEFRGQTVISDHTRMVVYIVFTVLAGTGTIMMFFLRSPKNANKRQYDVLENPNYSSTLQTGGEVQIDSVEGTDSDTSSSGRATWAECVENFKTTFYLLTNPDMLMLAIVFVYSGLELTFFSGVYGTSLANTKHFKTDANSLIGLSGIFIGLGEVIGGATFGMFGSKTIKYGRNPVILLGFLVHILAFFIIFLNIPAAAVLKQTTDFAYLTPLQPLAIFCSFLLGLADSCWNTQLYSILMSLFPNDSAPAFALFKFFQSGAAAVAFFYSPYLYLQWQLCILTGFALLASLAFFRVEWRLMAENAIARHERVLY